ncbi:nucleoside hydrolase [Albimonas sp. CAU 1670]|uniref:nucleoside hydrolase n=1 Tax=Albimonas sp. CAU 1670 TaxID=3032599 RepID=UPI0023DB88E4|nr:nucleoside hydrolase [Albimonas sp. CAU 1670]MDF2234134.1 nucleoside hydrolase [Albimonas sp. CAU 1670]
MGLWIDTDMSVDDVFAILLLQTAGEEIDGISLGFGVTPLTQVARNAAGAAQAFGWSIPLHAGAERAILGGQEHATRILGETGIRTRGRTLPEAAPPPLPPFLPALTAWLEAQERATVLALGPLTNLAVLALARPDLLPRIERIVWMGGGVTSGNHTASAEFNAIADPEALAILIARGVAIRMIDLDACRRVQIAEADVTALRAAPGPNADLLADLLGGYLDIALERGRETMALYDPVAAAAYARPDLFRFRSVRLDAELTGQHTRGRTVVETRHPHTHNAEIAEDLDAAAVKSLCLTALGAAA